MDPQTPARDPRHLGIDAGHHDAFGNWRTPPPNTIAQLRNAMGLDHSDPPSVSTLVVAPGDDGDWVTANERFGQVVPVMALGTTLRLEDGSSIDCVGSLPPDLPIGYHQVVTRDGDSFSLVASPGRCHLPAELRTWGVTTQLYAARSSQSWGIGDLADLARLTRWSDERGAGLVGLNPLHAPTPSATPPNSPYSPSSRRWRDPSTIAVESVPGFDELPDAAARIAEGRRLNDSAVIDRAASWRVKRSALEALWPRFRDSGGAAAFERFEADHGDALLRWGAFCVIADQRERSGLDPAWPTWPADVRQPAGSGIVAVIRERPDEVRFWCWLQWLTERQLLDAGSRRLVLTDLAVGFAADGFDAWEWQEMVATGVRIGAPPDPLGPDGQDWGLPPFVPWKIAAAGYRPFAETVRAAFRGSLGVRIDHVMGLFRLFWLPPGGSGADGAYVRFRHHDLLHVLAIESTRAGGLVVGEDLGTVEPGVRETLGAAGVLSTRLLWFEEGPIDRWPPQAQAAVTTHDLPTIAGVWTGTDQADLQAAGVSVPPDGDEQFRHRLRVAAGVDDTAAVDDVVVAAHRTVAGSPCLIATAALDDLVGAARRPNVPGTVDEHPNWRIPLPLALDDLHDHPTANAVAAVMAETRPPQEASGSGEPTRRAPWVDRTVS